MTETKNRLCRIVAAGEGILNADELKGGQALLIAADAGYEKLKAVGITPDLIMGDFDSSQRPEDAGCPILQHPSEKDDTDTGLAAEYAYSEGCREFIIYCATGGRCDHEFANYQLLVSLARRGCRAKLRGGRFDVYALHGGGFDTLTLAAAYGTVSVFAVSEKAEGVCIRGLKYPLEDHTLTCDYALGVSNERMGEEALISVKRGDLMVMVENV